MEGIKSRALMKGKYVNRGGPSDKWAGGNKKVEANVSKSKHLKAHRPIRGLVFGPSRGESELSASGKRLRVENEIVGRPGGVFAIESHELVVGESGKPGAVDNTSVVLRSNENQQKNEIVMAIVPTEVLSEKTMA